MTRNPIEALEDRIAPAALINPTTVTFTDVDGDLVTVKTTTGAFNLSQFNFGPGASSGELLLALTLTPDFAGASITITAKAAPGGGGDGFVTIGSIFSGADLAGIKIDGDLLALAAGDGDRTTQGLGSLQVKSMGALNTTGSSTTVNVQGGAGTVNVAHDVRNVVFVGTAFDASGVGFGSITVGGSMLGASGIEALGKIGSVKIGGDYNITPGTPSNVRIHGSSIGDVSIGGGIQAKNTSFGTGSIVSEGTMGLVKIGGSVRYGPSTNGEIRANGGIAGVSIGGGVSSVNILASSGDLGTVRIGGDMKNGNIFAAGNLASVAIRGSVLSTGDAGQILGNVVGNVTIGGDFQISGSGSGSGGRIFSNTTMGKVSIGGSVDASFSSAPNAGTIGAVVSMGDVKIKGSLLGGDGTNSGRILGGLALSSGVSLGNVTIGGSVSGGAGADSGEIVASGMSGLIKIGGDLAAGIGGASGRIAIGTAYNGLPAQVPGISIGGSIDSSLSPVNVTTVSVTRDLAYLIVKGGIEGNNGNGGKIQAGNIGKISVGRSIVSTGGLNAASVGTFTVGGNLIGTDANATLFEAVGTTGAAIASLSVKGTVQNVTISAGTSAGGIVNANGTIGKVTVGGDWIASNLVASAARGSDSFFGTTDDGGAPGGKIGPISIGGHARGSAASGDHFGIVASEIVSLKIGMKTFPLTAGPHNDLNPTLPILNIGYTADFTVREV